MQEYLLNSRFAIVSMLVERFHVDWSAQLPKRLAVSQTSTGLILSDSSTNYYIERCVTMRYTFDYNELLPDVIDRMKREHSEFRGKLDRIQDLVNEQNITLAISLLSTLKMEILRHAVEEEAIVARAIMKYSKNEAAESVRVLQGHRKLAHFFNEILPKLPMSTKENATRRVREFISFLLIHQAEEESIVFQLALKRGPSRGQ